jgi:hypothetical protein
MDDNVSKPVRREDFFAALARVLERRDVASSPEFRPPFSTHDC